MVMMGGFPKLSEIDAIVSDVDGTILTESHTVHPETIKEINRLKRLRPDIPFILASGKQIDSCDEVRNAIGIPIQAGNGGIHCNGSVIYGSQPADKEGGVKVLSEKGLPTEHLLRLIEHLKEYSTFLFDRDSVYFIQEEEDSDKDWLTIARKYDRNVLDKREMKEREEFMNKIREGEIVIVKISIAASPEVMDGLKRSIEKLFPSDHPSPVTVTRAVPFILEVMPEGVSKASALLELLASHKTPIDPLKVIAFGDGENDFPLLSSVGHGVIMENGMTVLKEEMKKSGKHYYNTGTNDQGGVAMFLREVIDAHELSHAT